MSTEEPTLAAMPDFTQAVAQLATLSGPVGLLLIALLTLVLVLFLIKVMQFVSNGILFSRSTARVRDIVEAFRQGTTSSLSKRQRAQAPASIALTATHHIQNGSLGEEALEKELKRQLSRYDASVRAYHRLLELVGSMAPLLGLLGTVLGMIEAFRQMQLAGRNIDPSILSGGIWQALLTTAIGISVAIPAIALHTWLESKADKHIAAVGGELERLMTLGHLRNRAKRS